MSGNPRFRARLTEPNLRSHVMSIWRNTPCSRLDRMGAASIVQNGVLMSTWSTFPRMPILTGRRAISWLPGTVAP